MEYLREYLLAEGLSPRSVKHYLGAARRADAWFVERGWDLTAASAVEISAYVAELPRSFASRNLTRAALRHFWACAGRADPPLRALRVPTKPAMVCKALDEGDARILAKAALAHGGREGLAVALALYLGLRREEVATLRWDAFTDGWVHVMGKGDRPRDLPVAPLVAELLAAHQRQGAYLFVGRWGGHVSPATIWEWFRRIADDAGLGLVSTHIARHTCLATANDRTGDLRSTQDWAGHANPAVTAGYTRTTKVALVRVMLAIDYDAAARAALDDDA